MKTIFGVSPKALVRDETGRVLIIRRSRESTHWPGQWDLPGGKMDPGETFDQTLLREAREETGLDIELTHLVGAAQCDVGSIRVVFLVMAAVVVAGQVRLSQEHEGFRWAAEADLPGLVLCDPIAKAMGVIIKGM